METKTFLRVTGVVAAALWIGSLFLPALATCPGANEQWYDGYYLLLFGMFGVSFGILGWYANMPFIAAVAMLLRGTVPNIFLSGWRWFWRSAPLVISGLRPMRGIWTRSARAVPVSGCGFAPS
jgi:hypothetical protein